MIPELKEDNVHLLGTMFLNLNVILPYPITLTTFVGYAFPTDSHHPEPWGRRAGQLRRLINSWLRELKDAEQVQDVISRKGRITFTWKDPMKGTALRAKAVPVIDQVIRDYVKDYVHTRLTNTKTKGE